MCNKVNIIEAKVASPGGLVSKSQHDSDKKTLKKSLKLVIKNIPTTNNLVSKTDFNTKVAEIENKTPDTSSILVINARINSKVAEIENEILDASKLVKKLITTQKLPKLKIRYFILTD